MGCLQQESRDGELFPNIYSIYIPLFASEFDFEVLKSMSSCTCSWIFFIFLYEQCLSSHLPFKVFHIFTGIILSTLKDFIFFLTKFRNVRAGRAWNDDGHLIILCKCITCFMFIVYIRGSLSI